MRLRVIEDKFSIGTWSWDLDTSEITWSPGLFRILGLDAATVVPTIDLYQSLVHPDDQLDFSNAIGLAADRRLQDRTFRIIRPDGSLRWLRSKGQPHFDRNGRPVAMFGVITDVTDVQELRTTLDLETMWRQALSRLLGDHIWRAYPNGKLVETTEWSKLTGQSPAEARNWDELAAIHPDDRKTFLDAWETAVATEKEYQATIRVLTVKGDYVTLTGRVLPVRGPSGEIQEWIGCTTYEHDARPQPRQTAPLHAAQVRAARALLNWSAPTLAREAQVSFSTVRRMEITTAGVRPENLRKVREVFELKSVRFFHDGEGRACIGLAEKSASG